MYFLKKNYECKRKKKPKNVKKFRKLEEVLSIINELTQNKV